MKQRKAGGYYGANKLKPPVSWSAYVGVSFQEKIKKSPWRAVFYIPKWAWPHSKGGKRGTWSKKRLGYFRTEAEAIEKVVAEKKKWEQKEYAHGVKHA